jgi:hypothetical protein
MPEESLITTKVKNLIHEISETLIEDDDSEDIRAVYRYIKHELESIVN